MKIYETIKKIPGGMMVVPLLLGAICHTIPWVDQNFLQLGGLTTALWSGSSSSPFIAATMFAVGAGMDFKQAGEAIKRGTVLLIAKFIAGASIGIIIGKTVGPQGIFGISALAIISAVTNSNGGLYMSLQGMYGTPTDFAAQVMLGINDGPFLTLLAFSASGMAAIPFKSILAAFIPMIAGVILCSFDPEFRPFFKPLGSIMIPFFAFCLGSAISLGNVVKAGVPGIILGVLCVIWSGAICIIFDKLVNRRPGYAGASVSSAAGNCVSTPALVAAAAPELAPYAESATVQCAAAVIITVIGTPLLATWAAKKWGTGEEFDAKKAAAKAAKAN